jgi:small subunit ribosomal protein S16
VGLLLCVKKKHQFRRLGKIRLFFFEKKRNIRRFFFMPIIMLNYTIVAQLNKGVILLDTELKLGKALLTMVTIRMARGGSKKRPFYNIVVTDSRKPRDSGYIERLGYYNPRAKGQEVRLNLEQERVDYWIKQGAQLSTRVNTLLKEAAKEAA